MILSVNNIYKSYGKEQVLKGITFEINQPQIIALVGPNGSGKSTLLNIITNLLPADKGEVKILGKSNRDPNIFREIAFMQDNTVLYDYLTGYDHLQFIGNIQGLSKKQLLDSAERIGITGYLNKKVKNYSLGMKQHLLLAMAVVNRPKLLILDEPLNGLDPTSAIRVRDLLLALREEGTTILLSSHNLAEIDRVTSTILFLKKGSLIQEDVSQFERIRYQFKVDDVVKAERALIAAGIPVEIVDDQLRMYRQDVSIDLILQTLEQEKITIDDIEKKVLGSEERYRKIFADTPQQSTKSIKV
ncbi:ABC transporter ATP-binding protein [Sporosarcina limicola]|uniref:ABC-2 type transport system ATP-binding protein n=1 Tax=Sporosarcina limicola TaxID=34101 RepID=A0A927RDI0_9BACL|nr:ABC transporter ATP-binding protein [Sporosarcina limicola]MBE1555360.1 ABC-2 type transport system ATP-binding protein [Sporosarcina limicola]